MLSLLLLCVLIILLSTLSVIRHLICGNNQSLLLNLNLIFKTTWIGAESGLLISMLEERNLFCLTHLITLVLLMLKWIGLFLRKKHLSRCWDWLSLLNLTETFTLSPLIKLSLKKLEPWFVLCFFLLRLLKTVSKKIGALICSMFLSPEIAMYLYKSTIQPCMDTVVMSGLVLPAGTWNC